MGQSRISVLTNEGSAIGSDYTLRSIITMVNLVASRDRISEALLIRRFREATSGYAYVETKHLLESLAVLASDNGSIKPGSNLRVLRATLDRQTIVFAQQFGRLLFASNGRYSVLARELMMRFSIEKGVPYLWIAAFSLKYYAMRNLLMELGVIGVDSKEKKYLVNTDFMDLFIDCRYSQGPSPSKLAKDMNEKEKIGLLAEEYVFEYEKKMARDDHRKSVCHIAKVNSAAGFDIVGVRTDENNICRLRLIEVKAVNTSDWRFVFTRNEIRVATENKDSYFLYLVPVTRGVPDVGKMKTLRHPLKILDNVNEWKIESGDWRVAAVSSLSSVSHQL